MMDERVNYPLPEEVSLHDYLIVLRRRRWTILLVFATVVLSALALSFLSTPIYRAEATIQIEEKKGPTFSLSAVAQTPMLGQTDPFRTEEEIIKSRSVVEKVVTRLNLDQENGVQSGNQAAVYDVQRAVQALQEQLSIQRVRNTNILKISLEDPDPEKAALIINTLASEYIDQNLMLSRREASQAREFVGEQLTDIRKELEERETALENMKASKGIVTLADNIKSDINRLSDVEQRKAILEMERRGLETLLVSIHNPRETVLPPVLSRDPVVTDLARRLTDMHVRMASLQNIYADSHPAVISLQATVADVEERLRQEIKNGLQALREQETALDQIIRRYEGQMQNLPQTERELVGIMRGLKSTEGIYAFLLQKEQETRIAEASEVENIRVVDSALPPQLPVKPRKLLNMILGALLGLMGGVGLAFFREYLDNSVRSPEEAERQTGLPVYGCVYLMAPQPSNGSSPENPYHPFLITQQSPMAVETYKSLRTNIEFMRGEQKIFVITSVAPGEGKSLTVANLSMMFSVMGLKVLVIDADLRNPSQHTIFEVNRKPGLSDVLAGREPWPTALKETTSVSGLHVLPSGSAAPGFTELLANRNFDVMLEEIKQAFDLILLDSPPVGFTDVAILGAKVDRLFFVIEAGKTSVRDINAAKQTLVHSKAQIAGVILNKISGEEHRYYYYHYYYHRGGERSKKPRYRRLVDRVKQAVGRSRA